MRKDDCKERSDASKIHCQDIDPETGEIITLVKQEFKDECDINWIMARMAPEAIMERFMARQGTYGDFSEIMDYQDAKNAVRATDEAFDSLPAKIRSMFENDVSKFLTYIEDPSNHEEAIKLGLMEGKVSEGADRLSVPPVTSSEGSGGSTEKAD
nr:MAG: internal scaffolding protein [Microviridae sp.]